MYPRTRRQKEVLDYILQFIETRGHQPSYQEIADHFRLASKGAVARHIEALERQGFLSRRSDDGAFSLEINPAESAEEMVCEISWMELPDSSDSTLSIPDDPLFISVHTLGVLKPDKVAAFKVANDAMLDDHICEGDIVILERRTLARDGDIVFAIVDGERAVLKRIRRSGVSIELHPSNSKYETISRPADRVEIRGVFRGLVRPLA